MQSVYTDLAGLVWQNTWTLTRISLVRTMAELQWTVWTSFPVLSAKVLAQVPRLFR
jgi:hypothetical protein